MRKTVLEYAQWAGISPSTVYRQVDRGKLKAERNNGATYVILNDSEAQHVTQQEETPRVADANQRLADENCWLRDRVESFERQIIDLTQQLANANQRAEETSNRHDTIVMQLTQQLDRSHTQLEDLRKPQPLWRRLFRR